jgi:general secretion pathway protein M
MKDWFNNLDEREKTFVSVGAVLVVVSILYAFIWLPIDKGHKSLAMSVATWEKSLAELRPLQGAQPAEGAATQNQQANSQQTPVVIVDQTLRARGLDRSLKRSQPTTSNGIRVEFENVAFDDLVLWLGDLSRQYAMDVASGSFSATSQSDVGRINATLTLERVL